MNVSLFVIVLHANASIVLAVTVASSEEVRVLF